MARYKPIDTSPRFLAVDLDRQLLPGTFGHALGHLIDHELDLGGFDARYRNDKTGAPAFLPGMRLKVVLFACSRASSGAGATPPPTSCWPNCAGRWRAATVWRAPTSPAACAHCSTTPLWRSNRLPPCAPRWRVTRMARRIFQIV